MEQFNLDTWLKDKSRKVVTRRGNPVRIVCWDLKCNTPIIAAIQWNQEREDCYCYNTKGRCANNVGELDLFFADEEEELTEFEKCIQNILNEPHFQDIEAVKQFSKTLLDLARKEISKSLPKWKKAKKNEELDCHVAIQQDGRVVLSDFVQKDEYYITLNVLKKLPKEE